MFRKIRRKLLRLAIVSGAGAATNYFFDRDRGVERRDQAKAKAASLVGRPAPAGDWQSSSANGFDAEPPAFRPAEPAVPTVADMLDGAHGEAEVEVLVVEPAGAGPQNGTSTISSV